MKGLELLEKHALSAEIVRAWFMERMIESFKDENVPDEFKDFMREQGIDNVINPTEYSTRKECELISITRAFEILENKLTPKELNDETDN